MQTPVLQRRALLRALLAGGAAAGVGAMALRPATAAACTGNGQRVVSIGGAVTEIAAALNAMCRIVATDTTSLYPRAVFDLPRVGYMRALAAEGIVALNPSLVLVSDRSGPEAVLRQIKDAGVDLRLIPDDPHIEAIAAKIIAVGEALDLKAQATALATAVDDDIAALRAQVAGLKSRPRVLFLLSVARAQLMAGGADTAADAMIKLAGGVNAVNVRGFKPISAESALDVAPDAVLMMHQTLDAAGGIDAVLALPALASSPAARNRRLIAMEGTYLLGLGPRVAHAGRDLAAALHPEAALSALPERAWALKG
ncbi:MAG: periplasmic binding protein [Alphaproteobacteria bacterium]|jgi:iron complex transport system substrate-binding protein|nr:periplasmic binding protein [Alphaproteobacteria bacterium]